MQKSRYLFFVSLVCLLLFASSVNAYVTGNGFLCINGTGATDLSEDFQAALDAVANSGANAELRLVITQPGVATSYPIPLDTHFNIITTNSLDISGGWNTDCSSQTANSPELTILVGGTNQTGPGGVLSVIIEDNDVSATVSIHNLTIKSGSSQESGGGFYFLHTATAVTAATAILNLYDIIIENNLAEGFGSGIHAADNGTSGGMSVEISDCIVRNNNVRSSTGGPGGISVEVPSAVTTGARKADTFISNCQILNNSASEWGGGLYINSGTGNTTLVNNVIAGNSVSNDNGGGLSIYNPDGGNITLTNNTITENVTTGGTTFLQDGGGLYVDLNNAISSLGLYNNIFFNNAAAGVGDDFLIFNLGRNTITINNNDFNDTPDTGYLIDGDTTNLETLSNINADPLFENVANGNYHLATGSPAIDAGDNAAPAIPDFDIDGVSRPQNSTVDMGAYEANDPDNNSEDTIGGDGCFIATAAYGSYMADDVMVLRKLRDEYLLTNPAGRAFVKLYYAYSPPIADYIAEHDALRATTRIVLTPLVCAVKYPLIAGSVFMLFGIFLVGGLAGKPEEH